MFYEPGKTHHGLPYDPFKACVIPRPIGWISTASPTKVGQEPKYNLAPYSQFNNLTFDPPYVMFSANQNMPTDEAWPGPESKDTVVNAEATGYFCWQLATYKLRESVNITAEPVPYGVDEFERAGLEKTWSTILPLRIPMVKDSPVRFECQYHTTIRLPGNPPMGTVDIVIGRVLGVHIDDGVISPEGRLDPKLTEPIARLGYYDYCVVRDTFQMIIPNNPTRLLGGLEGSIAKHREILEEEKERDKSKREAHEGASGLGEQ